MSEFKVGCSPLTSRIYAGRVLKNGTWGSNKKDVTDSAVSAVAQNLLQTGQKLLFTYHGKSYELKVEEIQEGQNSQFICSECQEHKREWLDGMCEDCTLESFNLTPKNDE